MARAHGAKGASPSWSPETRAAAATLQAGGKSTGEFTAPKVLPLFEATPYRVFTGHESDVIDLAWSKHNFLVTASMDKTARLWHVTKTECLCTFQHPDVVTCVAMHPQDDALFVSGSLDEKLRVWNIRERRVVQYAETGGFVTSASFANHGKTIITGSFSGKCNFYQTQGLRYVTQLHVRSHKGKNKKGHKITGIEVSPRGDKILVTSTDSRVRLYHLKGFSQALKYKGFDNSRGSRIKATFSGQGDFIICGSEDSAVYIWDVDNKFEASSSLFRPSHRKDHNKSHESYEEHSAVVTTALFAPFSSVAQCTGVPKRDGDPERSYLISADFDGKLLVRGMPPSAGAQQAMDARAASPSSASSSLKSPER